MKSRTNFVLKNQALPVGSVTQVIELTPHLDPHLYQALNTTHRCLKDTNPQLAKDCWLCLSLGAPCYLATPIPLNNATAMGTPIDPNLQGPVLRAIELTQKAPEFFTNDGGTEP